MILSLGFSPCPNDCFMFDAIVNQRIDLEGLSFAPHLADVEALNRETFSGSRRRHEAQLSRLRDTVVATTCCSTRAARSAETAGRC